MGRPSNNCKLSDLHGCSLQAGARRTPNLLGCAITTVSRAKSGGPQVEIKSMALRARVDGTPKRWSALPELGRRPENGCRPAEPDSDRQRRRGRRPEAAGHCGHRERRTLRGHRCVRDEKFSGAASGFLKPGGPMFQKARGAGDAGSRALRLPRLRRHRRQPRRRQAQFLVP